MQGSFIAQYYEKRYTNLQLFSCYFYLKDYMGTSHHRMCKSFELFPAQVQCHIHPCRHGVRVQCRPPSLHLRSRRCTPLHATGACGSRFFCLLLSLRWRTMPVAASWQERHPSSENNKRQFGYLAQTGGVS